MAFRIDSPGALNGAFTEGNPASGTPATVVSADWLNMLQEEIMTLLGAAGIAPARADSGQIAAAVRALILQQAGLLGDLRNTDVGNLLNLISALQGRVNNLETQRTTDLGNLNDRDSAIISRFALLEGKGNGRLLRVVSYPRGIYTHPFAADCGLAYAEIVAPGGSGGGGPVPPAGQAMVGGGAGAGGYTSVMIYSPIQNGHPTVAVTVGSGPDGRVGDSGLQGGVSSFGPFGYANGGFGGSSFGVSNLGLGGSAQGGNIGAANDESGFSNGVFVSGGAPGETGWILSPDRALGGAGGDGPWGGGGGETGENQNGNGGSGPGAGGSGCCMKAGQGPGKGGKGADGAVIVWEYSRS